LASDEEMLAILLLCLIELPLYPDSNRDDKTKADSSAEAGNKIKNLQSKI
jgi:hypothetical protein